MNIKNLIKATVIASFAMTSIDVNAQNTSDQPQYMNRGGATTASWEPSLVRDGVYDKINHYTKPLEWQPVREADILWKKRVWRTIDTRIKQNLPFRYPGDDETGGGTFIEIILDAVKKGKVKAYQTYGQDAFQNAMPYEQIAAQLTGGADTIPQIDPITGDETFVIRDREFNPDNVATYRIKEDVLFDRNLGRVVTRIIGIAPVLSVVVDGEYRGETPMFWIYYPELRETLAQYEVFNPDNDIHRITWDDFFEGRRFASNITKVSNPRNDDFRDMGLTPMEALWESQRVSEELFNREHDMWSY